MIDYLNLLVVENEKLDGGRFTENKRNYKRLSEVQTETLHEIEVFDNGKWI